MSSNTGARAASASWERLNWAWIHQAAGRCARRTGAEREDLAHAIALEAVIEFTASPGLSLHDAINRAEHRVEAAHQPRGFRPQSAPARFPGARISPADWRALLAWLRRTIPDRGRRANVGRQLLELTLGGESIERAADRLGLSLARAKSARSIVLRRCLDQLARTQ